MSINQGYSKAELIDKVTQRLALALLLVALLLSASAAAYIVSDQTGWYLSMVERGLSVIVIGVIFLSILPLLVIKFSMHAKQQSIQIESFINDAAKKAFALSWAVTFMLIVLIAILTDDDLSTLPIGCLLDIMKAIMAGTFAVSFLILNRTDSEAKNYDGDQGG